MSLDAGAQRLELIWMFLGVGAQWLARGFGSKLSLGTWAPVLEPSFPGSTLGKSSESHDFKFVRRIFQLYLSLERSRNQIMMGQESKEFENKISTRYVGPFCSSFLSRGLVVLKCICPRTIFSGFILARSFESNIYLSIRPSDFHVLYTTIGKVLKRRFKWNIDPNDQKLERM